MYEKAMEVRDHEFREPSTQSMVQKVNMPMAATPSPLYHFYFSLGKRRQQ